MRILLKMPLRFRIKVPVSRGPLFRRWTSDLGRGLTMAL
jgi:hypothetical protein